MVSTKVYVFEVISAKKVIKIMIIIEGEMSNEEKKVQKTETEKVIKDAVQFTNSSSAVSWSTKFSGSYAALAARTA